MTVGMTSCARWATNVSGRIAGLLLWLGRGADEIVDDTPSRYTFCWQHSSEQPPIVAQRVQRGLVERLVFARVEANGVILPALRAEWLEDYRHWQRRLARRIRIEISGWCEIGHVPFSFCTA